MPIKDLGPKSLQKEEWNEYMTETNKKGMFRIESKKQMVTRVLPAMPAGPCRDTGTRKEEAVGSKREKCLKTRAPPPLCWPGPWAQLGSGSTWAGMGRRRAPEPREALLCLGRLREMMARNERGILKATGGWFCKKPARHGRLSGAQKGLPQQRVEIQNRQEDLTTEMLM